MFSFGILNTFTQSVTIILAPILNAREYLCLWWPCWNAFSNWSISLYFPFSTCTQLVHDRKPSLKVPSRPVEEVWPKNIFWWHGWVSQIKRLSTNLVCCINLCLLKYLCFEASCSNPNWKYFATSFNFLRKLLSDNCSHLRQSLNIYILVYMDEAIQ